MPRIDNFENGNLHIHIPIAFRSCGARRTIIATGDDSEPEKSPLALSLARAFRWEKLLTNGDFASAKDISRAVSSLRHRRLVCSHSPKIVHRISRRIQKTYDALRIHLSLKEQERVFVIVL
jgi:hypothetical protein